MIQNIAAFIVERQIKSGKLTPEDKEVFCYGYEILVSNILHLLLSLAVGIFWGKIIEITIFLAAYTLLRSYAGGYHAPKRIICSIISFGVVFAVGVINHIKYYQIPEWILYSTLIFLTIFISTLSTVEAINKPLNSNEKKRNRHITMGLLFLWNLLSYLSVVLLNSKVVLFNVVLVYISVFLLQIMGAIKYEQYRKGLLTNL